MAAMVRLNRNAVVNTEIRCLAFNLERNKIQVFYCIFQHSLSEQPVNSESTQAACDDLSVGLEPKRFHKYIGAKPILHFKDEQSNPKINSLLEKKSHMKVKTDLKGSILHPLSSCQIFAELKLMKERRAFQVCTLIIINAWMVVNKRALLPQSSKNKMCICREYSPEYCVPDQNWLRHFQSLALGVQ